jgi:hypothetical protein
LARIGNARFYVYTGGALTFESYMAGLKAGRTFVTTGPMLNLTVNGKMPGDTLAVAPGAKLHVVAEAMGDVQSVSIVGHGKVLAQSAGKRVELDVTASHGMWIAARCDGGRLQVAHTTPVYVTVNGGGFHNPRDAGEECRDFGGLFEGARGGAGESATEPGRAGPATSHTTGTADCGSAHGAAWVGPVRPLQMDGPVAVAAVEMEVGFVGGRTESRRQGKQVV